MKLKTMTVEDLAAVLQKSVHTVRCDVTRRPETLPPRIQIPGSRTVLWLEQDVIDWLESLRDPKASKDVTRFLKSLRRK